MSRRTALLLLTALIIRLALAPISYHPWEYRTYTNTAADLQDGVNPYVHFHQLCDDASDHYDGEVDYYEYWAYPPAYLSWLVVIAQTDPPRTAPFAEFREQQPDLWLQFLLKLPPILADFLCAWLLYLLARRYIDKPRRAAWLWLFCPLTWYLSAVWGTFDSVAIAFMLGALLLAHRYVWAGLLLGLGFAVKIMPAFIGPAFLQQWHTRRWVVTVAGAVLAVGFASAYYLIESPWEYISAVVGFHGQRYGGGLTLASVWQLGEQNRFWDVWFGGLWMIPMVGLWVWVWRKHSSNVIICAALLILAFLLTSKLVNPVYCLYLVPFLLILGVPSLGQLLMWQLLIIGWISVNLDSPAIMFLGLAQQIGWDIGPPLPLDDRYMLYLGLGWLLWALHLSFWFDVLRVANVTVSHNLTPKAKPSLHKY